MMGRCLGGGKGRGRKRGEGVFLLVFTYLAVVFVIVGKIDLHRLRRRLCPPCRICSRVGRSFSSLSEVRSISPVLPAPKFIQR